jgi:hypothetical protein
MTLLRGTITAEAGEIVQDLARGQFLADIPRV